MEHRAGPLTRRQSDKLIEQEEANFSSRGFGLWAVERRRDGRLLGFTGLATSQFDAQFCPAVDIGWQLARDAWGYGYATEGARAVLVFAFDELRLSEVLAHTTRLNKRSRAVMRRLGMTHNPNDDFDGPWYRPGHPRRRFVLYRLQANEWGRSKLSPKPYVPGASGGRGRSPARDHVEAGYEGGPALGGRDLDPDRGDANPHSPGRS